MWYLTPNPTAAEQKLVTIVNSIKLCEPASGQIDKLRLKKETLSV